MHILYNIIKFNNMETIVVGMSGGVDSSTTAELLKKQGFNVIGLTLRLCNDDIVQKDDESEANIKLKAKHEASETHIRDAKIVAEKMNIPHSVLDYGKKFHNIVIQDFINGYAEGRTPSPCILCNKYLKFHELINYADSINAKYVATGHYVKSIYNEKTQRRELHRGSFLHGDQSYFLATLSQDQINRLIFPLGDFETKKQTRELARELNVPTADKTASQDICFTAKHGHSEFISKVKPESIIEGNILSVDGKILGKHKGIINYTIGQRKGINISASTPLYTIQIDAKTNSIIVGEEKYLYRKTFLIKDINWLHENKDIDNYKLDVKIRIGQPPVAALLKRHDDKILVILDEPQKGIAPGQLCAFYENTRVLGGGWII